MDKPNWWWIKESKSGMQNIGGADRLGCAPFPIVVREPKPVVTAVSGICVTRQGGPPKCAPDEMLKVSALDAANARNSGGCAALSAAK